MPAADPRSDLTRAAVRLVVAVAGRPAGPVNVVVTCGSLRVEESLSAADVARILGPPQRPPLTLVEQQLLAALTDRESKPAAIAHRAGKRCTAHVYAALKSLVGKGCAARGERGGYLLVPP